MASRLRILSDLPRYAVAAALNALMSACSDAPQGAAYRNVVLKPQEAVTPAGPPTVTRLVMKLQDGNPQMLSARAKRGNLAPVRVARNLSDIRRGDKLLAEYRTLDAVGNTLNIGRLLLSQELVAEYLDPVEHHKIRRQGPERVAATVFRVAVPYHVSLAAVAFDELLPHAT